MALTFARDPRPRIQYSGDGGRTTFAFPFEVLADDDILVFLGAAAATGYAVSGLGDPLGGEITFLAPPAAGVTVTLLRRTEGIRESAFLDGGPFRAASINAELDRVMLLIQEDRDEHGRALRAGPTEGESDFSLPGVAERANKLLGFDSLGRPAAFAQTELPDSGDASGTVVTPIGAVTARALGEHLAAVVNVRDFGATGDGVTDDAAAFQAALAAAQASGRQVYVPAGPNAYLIGATLTLDGVAMAGAGAGSLLKLGLASGTGLQLAGRGARLAAVRVLGPAAVAWPSSALEVDLAGVTLDGIQVAPGAEDAVVAEVEVAGCHTGLAIAGGVKGIVRSTFAYNRNGIELRAGAVGPIAVTGAGFEACTRGLSANTAAAFGGLCVRSGRLARCGHGVDLPAPATGRRSVELDGLRFTGCLEANLAAGPRQSLGLRACTLDASGKRSGAGIELKRAGETTTAPTLIAENNRAEVTQVATVQLSGGSNLNLLQAGDLVVLATDADDVDDLWTALKATRGGVVHKVTAQTTATATLELAVAADRPLVLAGDVIRVVGRSGTASAGSVGASAPAGDFVWLRADDHCRVLAAHNPMPAAHIELAGSNGMLHLLPGLGGEAARIGGVQLVGGAVNGGFVGLVTFELGPNTAASFAPASTIGMVHAFGHGTTGDLTAAVFSYRADAVGYIKLLAGAAEVAVTQGVALTGTTGTAGKFTYSAHSNGRIYVENRLSGTRKVSLFVIGAPL